MSPAIFRPELVWLYIVIHDVSTKLTSYSLQSPSHFMNCNHVISKSFFNYNGLNFDCPGSVMA